MPKKITESAIQECLQILKDTPQRIWNCLGHHSEEALRKPPARDEWSAVQILSHVRSGIDVWSYSIYAMLILDNPQLAFIHPRVWDKKIRYKDVSFAESFQTYEIERRKLLHTLERLSFEDWGRTCTFTGKKNVFNIFMQASRIAGHEVAHCQQLEAIFPKQ